MKQGSRGLHGHSDLGDVHACDVEIVVPIPTSRCGEQPYRCNVVVRSTCKALIDWLRSLPSADRAAFADIFFTKDHLGELALIQVEQVLFFVEMLFPWKGDESVYFSATLAVVGRYKDQTPNRVDIQIEPTLFPEG